MVAIQATTESLCTESTNRQHIYANVLPNFNSICNKFKSLLHLFDNCTFARLSSTCNVSQYSVQYLFHALMMQKHKNTHQKLMTQ